MTRKRSIPHIDDGGLLAFDPPGDVIPVNSAAWYYWLERASSFAFHGADSSFTAHKEKRGSKRAYWKAYRKRGGRLERIYLGRSEEITLDRLTTVAAMFAVMAADTGASSQPSPAIVDPAMISPVTAARPVASGATSAAARSAATGIGIRNTLGARVMIPMTRSTLIARPHLITKLNTAIQNGQRLILVSAPAGSGKTTTVITWLRQVRSDVAWLSLDAADNDLGLFFATLIAALDHARPGSVAEAETLLHAYAAHPPEQAIVTSLLNALADSDRRLILVMDDYHLIVRQPIHALLAHLIERMPFSVHIVLTSRADPPLPLARLRARGQLTEIRAADLRFSLSEAAALIEETHRLVLQPSVVAALTARTEGWVTGLHLAALALHQAASRATDFLADFTGSHRYIFSYLADEVFAQQTETVQAFLLKTSILGRMCASLCVAVTGQAEASTLLAELDARNLFINQLDQQQQWYRYHQLFRGFLMERLKQSLSHEEYAELHRRASEWFARNGFMSEAVEHLMSAQDWAAVFACLAPLMASEQMYSYLLDWPRWLAALPDAALQAHQDMTLRLTRVLIDTGHGALTGRPLALVEAIANTHGDTAQIGVVRALQAAAHAFQGDAEGAARYAHEALSYLPPKATEQRAYATYFLGVSQITLGNLRNALPLLVEAYAVLQLSNEPLFAIGAQFGLALAYHMQGRFKHAAALYHGVIERAGSSIRQQVPFAHHRLGILMYEWNNLTAAFATVQKRCSLVGWWYEADREA
jgi:LuxR family maltose regulon positive regulatory protein